MSPPRSPGADVTERLSYKRWQMSAGRNNSDSENRSENRIPVDLYFGILNSNLGFISQSFFLPGFLTAKQLWNKALKTALGDIQS